MQNSNLNNNLNATSQVTNAGGHLYKDSKYAHFSQITKHNQHLFPLFPKAKPITFELNKGDCLYIPKTWWHWVNSFGSRCLSVNFWFHTNMEVPLPPNYKRRLQFDRPVKYKNAINDWKAFERWNDQYLIDKIDPVITEGLWLCLYDGICKKRISLAEFIEKYNRDTNPENEFAYLITPTDYEPHKEKHNAKILDILASDFHPPFPYEMLDYDANFWMNFGGIDTGLHYDDDEGLLCVVEGTKIVTLYPPSDSEYLYPYPITPTKLIPHKKYFHYNLYKETHALDVEVTSAQILETALLRSPNIAIIARKLQEKYGAGRIIYGIKNMNGIIRYEFYFYGIDKNINIAPEKSKLFDKPEYNKDWNIEKYFTTTHKELFPNDDYDLSNIQKNGLAIFSIDLTENDVIRGITPNINLYYTADNAINIPFFLVEKTYFKDGSQSLRSLIITEKYDEIMLNIDTFRSSALKIKIEDEDTKNMIRFMHGSPYKCMVISLFNKPEEVGLYFFGISYDAFVQFLIEYDYPVKMIELIVDKKEDISKLHIEIGFHFLKGSTNFTPSRTAFYGLF